MSWIIKALLNLIALVVYIVVITGVRSCLFDNFDKTIYGICTSCNEFIETKVEASVLLVALFIATVILGRSVSVLPVIPRLHSVHTVCILDTSLRCICTHTTYNMYSVHV